MKVLIVDDEPEVLREVEYALQKTTGPDGNAYKVTALNNQAAALNLLSKERFDVVITDMVMGETGKEGIDVLAVVRQLGNKSPVTIVITAWPKFPVCVEAMRLGAWDYLEKQPMDGGDFFENLINSLEAAWEYRRKFPDAGRMHPDMAWAEEHFGELAEEYPGKYVAVLDKEVIDSDDDYGGLMIRLTNKYPLVSPSIIALPPKEENGKVCI